MNTYEAKNTRLINKAYRYAYSAALLFFFTIAITCWLVPKMEPCLYLPRDYCVPADSLSPLGLFFGAQSKGYVTPRGVATYLSRARAEKIQGTLRLLSQIENKQGATDALPLLHGLLGGLGALWLECATIEDDSNEAAEIARVMDEEYARYDTFLHARLYQEYTRLAQNNFYAMPQLRNMLHALLPSLTRLKDGSGEWGGAVREHPSWYPDAQLRAKFNDLYTQPTYRQKKEIKKYWVLSFYFLSDKLERRNVWKLRGSPFFVSPHLLPSDDPLARRTPLSQHPNKDVDVYLFEHLLYSREREIDFYSCSYDSCYLYPYTAAIVNDGHGAARFGESLLRPSCGENVYHFAQRDESLAPIKANDIADLESTPLHLLTWLSYEEAKQHSRTVGTGIEDPLWHSRPTEKELRGICERELGIEKRDFYSVETQVLIHQWRRSKKNYLVESIHGARGSTPKDYKSDTRLIAMRLQEPCQSRYLILYYDLGLSPYCLAFSLVADARPNN